MILLIVVAFSLTASAGLISIEILIDSKAALYVKETNLTVKFLYADFIFA